MKKWFRVFWVMGAGLLVFFAFQDGQDETLSGSVSSAFLKEKVSGKLSSLSAFWIPNRGQIKNKEILYYAKLSGAEVAVTKDAVFYYFREGNKLYVVKEFYRGASSFRIKPVGKLSTRVNYLLGDDSRRWKTNIPVYKELALGEIYPDISLSLIIRDGSVEKIVRAKEGADLSRIRVAYEGVDRIEKEGERIVLEAGGGKFWFSQPVAKDEAGREVEVAYSVCDGGWGFVALSEWEGELTIDPLLSSTFIGGSDDDEARALAIGSDGSVYVAGYTYSHISSSDYPTTSGVYDTSHNGDYDVFVSKLDSSLSTLEASTFIGGSGYEEFYALAISSSDSVYVTGYTESSDYPTKSGAYQTSRSDSDYGDVFVSKLDASLSTLEASTFLGGADFEEAHALAVASDGSVYVAGRTASSDYPTTPGAYNTTHGNYYDVFVSKLDSSLSTLEASTFIGGANDEDAQALVVSSDGSVYVAGGTDSSDYPATGGAYNTSYNGGYEDVFVSKLDSSLSTLEASTFLGGTAYDMANALAIASDGSVYVAGNTDSSDYPTTPGAYDASQGGNDDVFVSKLDASLSTIEASTFIGGTDDERAHALAVASDGNVYVAGWTASSNYPTTSGAYDTTHGGGDDAFVSKLDASLSTLEASIFIGGTGDEDAQALVVNSDGSVYVAGGTDSSDYPATSEAYDTSCNGGYEVLVSKFDPDLSWIKAPTSLSASYSDGKVHLTWTDNSNYEQGFKVYRSTTPGFTADESGKIAEVGADVTSYDDTSVSESTTYYYRVKAYYDTQDSEPSNEASVSIKYTSEQEGKQEGESEVAITNNIVEGNRHFGVYARESATIKIYTIEGGYIDSFKTEANSYTEYTKKLGRGLYILLIETDSGKKIRRKLLVQ